jgi:hypothetical protein
VFANETNIIGKGEFMNGELNKFSSNDFWLMVFITAAIGFMVSFAGS